MTADTVRPANDDARPGRHLWFTRGERRTRRRRLAGVAGVLLAGMLATAAVPSLTFANASGGSVKQTCMEVGAVLSDGPDPGADPVGYAQAQILPLRQIHTNDAELKRAIDQLDSAYRTFVHDNGKGKPAHSAVSAAAKKLDAICPGVTS